MGKYAGYFRGDVFVENNIYADNIPGSDIRIKKDIIEIDSSLTKILKIKGQRYKLIPVNERGQGSAVIYGSELYAGTYLYTLITDGRIVGTYTMILTN